MSCVYTARAHTRNLFVIQYLAGLVFRAHLFEKSVRSWPLALIALLGTHAAAATTATTKYANEN